MINHRGTVLLFVLGISATLAAALSLAQQQQLHNLTTLSHQLAATETRYLALSGHALASNLLYQDLQNNQHDGIGDVWHRYHHQETTLPVAEGSLSFQLSDATAKPNLNQLYTAIDNQDKRYQQGVEGYLASYNITADLLPQIIDWVDPDEKRRSGGAESSDYLTRDIPYKAANRKLVSHVSLPKLRSFTPEDHADYLRLFNVLPTFINANINTVEQRFLQYLWPELSPQNLNKVINNRQRRPYTNTADILDDLAMDNLPPNVKLGVNSQLFKLTARAISPAQTLTLNVLYERKSGAVHVRRILWH